MKIPTFFDWGLVLLKIIYESLVKFLSTPTKLYPRIKERKHKEGKRREKGLFPSSRSHRSITSLRNSGISVVTVAPKILPSLFLWVTNYVRKSWKVSGKKIKYVAEEGGMKVKHWSFLLNFW